MEIRSRDALNECLFLFRAAIRVGAEIPLVEQPWNRTNPWRQNPGDCQGSTPDAKRPGIGRLEVPLGAKKSFGDVPTNPVCKLRELNVTSTPSG